MTLLWLFWQILISYCKFLMSRPLKWSILGTHTIILSKNIHKVTKTDYVWFKFLWIRRYWSGLAILILAWDAILIAKGDTGKLLFFLDALPIWDFNSKKVYLIEIKVQSSRKICWPVLPRSESNSLREQHICNGDNFTKIQRLFSILWNWQKMEFSKNKNTEWSLGG